MASRPSATSSHSASGESAPPGHRPLTATIAIGSVWLAGVRERREVVTGAPDTRVIRRSTRAAGVGKSNTSVLGSVRSVTAASPSRNRTAPSESKPRSRKVCSSSIWSVPVCPSTPAAVVRTRSASRSRSACGDSAAASGCSGVPVPVPAPAALSSLFPPSRPSPSSAEPNAAAGSPSTAVPAASQKRRRWKA